VTDRVFDCDATALAVRFAILTLFGVTLMLVRASTLTLASVLVSSFLASTVAAAPPTAQYRVTFTGLWTPQTHPINYPSGAHFSPLIGGTLAAPSLLWADDGQATNGIESMAETGSKTALRSEVLARIAGGTAGVVVESAGGTTATGTVFADFTVSQSFPYASVVSMIAPSPDWFVGTNDTLLFSGGAWVPEIVVSLQPYDAGTDSGISYASADADTNPQTPIAEIIGFPVAPPGQFAAPFAQMRFTRTDAPPCPADLDHSGSVNGADLTVFLGAWGGGPGPVGDMTGDGVIDGNDLAVLLASWGACG